MRWVRLPTMNRNGKRMGANEWKDSFAPIRLPFGSGSGRQIVILGGLWILSKRERVVLREKGCYVRLDPHATRLPRLHPHPHTDSVQQLPEHE